MVVQDWIGFFWDNGALLEGGASAFAQASARQAVGAVVVIIDRRIETSGISVELEAQPFG